MKLHILGICGTFMGSLALLGRQAGHRVTGSDEGVYPPMSELLDREGVAVSIGFDPATIPADSDVVLVGNALSRGNPAVEHLLEADVPFTSGPAWLSAHVLAGRRVLAVAGTHGKTSTASIAAWLLQAAGREPGFLIGGVPGNFPVSARLGTGRDFVIEADEYDTAFFDKRSKFVHYRPRILLLNNLEYDHADIFTDLAAIQRQVHHVVRIVPGSGTVIVNGEDPALAEVLAMGCWTPVTTFGKGPEATWRLRLLEASGRVFELEAPDGRHRVEWSLAGGHNALNAVAAVAAVAATGVPTATAVAALPAFRLPRRRQETVAEPQGVLIVDDFAHHPTAVRETLAALAAAHPERRVLAAFELRSNSMRAGAHGAALGEAFGAAAAAWVVPSPGTRWDPERLRPRAPHVAVTPDVDTLLATLADAVRPGDLVVFMSNGSFDRAPARLAARLGPVAPADA